MSQSRRTRLGLLTAVVILIITLTSDAVQHWSGLVRPQAIGYYSLPLGVLTIMFVEVTYRLTPWGRREAHFEVEGRLDDIRLRMGDLVEEIESLRLERESLPVGDEVGADHLARAISMRTRHLQDLERDHARARSRLRYLDSEDRARQSAQEMTLDAASSAVVRVRGASNAADSTSSGDQAGAVPQAGGPEPHASGLQAEHPFVEFGALEARSASTFRSVSFLVLIASLMAALGFSWFAPVEDDAAALVRKLAPGIPLAVLFAYLAREAARHRANELWARRNAILLQALPPFLANVEDETSVEVRRAFALSLFHAAPMEEQPPDASSGPLDLTALGQIQGLLGQIQALAGQVTLTSPPQDGQPQRPPPS